MHTRNERRKDARIKAKYKVIAGEQSTTFYKAHEKKREQEKNRDVILKVGQC